MYNASFSDVLTSFPVVSMMVISTSPVMSATLLDHVPSASSMQCLSGVKLSSNFLNLDSSLMMWVVAPQSTSRAFGFPVALYLQERWSEIRMEALPSHQDIPKSQKLSLLCQSYFSLCVDMFCYCMRSYDTCCTSVSVRSFPWLYYYRNERYALVGRIENRWHAAGILAFVPSSWLTDFRSLCWLA